MSNLKVDFENNFHEAIRLILEQAKQQSNEEVTLASAAVENGRATIILETNQERAKALEPLRQEIEEKVSALAEVDSAMVILTANSQGADIHPHLKKQQSMKMNNNVKLELPNVKKIIAVASGKGGVGKSTTAVNLALAFAKSGFKVGLIDADIHGPSVPKMLGLLEKPRVKERTIFPIEKRGIKSISMGSFINEDTPVPWRGPVTQGALQQFLKDVEWGELDLLILDMPPGTGDSAIALVQKVPVDGILIVSTPQDIALLDSIKALNLFKKYGAPVLGMIENMSSYTCPKCGHEEHIFDTGGAEKRAKELDVPFLGHLPLNIDLRKASDAGAPLVDTDPDHPISKIYNEISEKISNALITKS